MKHPYLGICLCILTYYFNLQIVTCQDENQGSASGNSCTCENCNGEINDDETCQCNDGYIWESSNCNADSSLSPGAIVGIVIGSVIGFFLLVLLGYYFVLQKPNKTSASFELNSSITYNKHRDVCHSVSEIGDNGIVCHNENTKQNDMEANEKQASKLEKDESYQEQSTNF